MKAGEKWYVYCPSDREFLGMPEARELRSVKQTFLSSTELRWTCNDRINHNLKVDRYHYEGMFAAVSMKIAFSIRMSR